MEYIVDKFTFFVSYFQAIERLSDDREKLEFIEAILRYAFYGEMPEFEDKLAAMFDLLKPNIDKSIKNIKTGTINGAKGGAPAGNQNAKKKTTHGLNENKTEKDMDMEKEMEDGKETGNITYDRAKISPKANINFEKIYA